MQRRTIRPGIAQSARPVSFYRVWRPAVAHSEEAGAYGVKNGAYYRRSSFACPEASTTNLLPLKRRLFLGGTAADVPSCKPSSLRARFIRRLGILDKSKCALFSSAPHFWHLGSLSLNSSLTASILRGDGRFGCLHFEHGNEIDSTVINLAMVFFVFGLRRWATRIWELSARVKAQSHLVNAAQNRDSGASPRSAG